MRCLSLALTGILGALAALLNHATPALLVWSIAVMAHATGDPADAAAAASSAATIDPHLAMLAVHAAAVAGAVRLAVKVLRSGIVEQIPIIGAWNRLHPAVRPLLLLALGAAAAACDHLASGAGVGDAVFAALGGVMGAVFSHEIQDRIVRGEMPKG